MAKGVLSSVIINLKFDLDFVILSTTTLLSTTKILLIFFLLFQKELTKIATFTATISAYPKDPPRRVVTDRFKP